MTVTEAIELVCDAAYQLSSMLAGSDDEDCRLFEAVKIVRALESLTGGNSERAIRHQWGTQ